MSKNSSKGVDLPSGITRRDFVNSLLVGTGAALCNAPAPFGARAATDELLPEPDLGSDWYGYGVRRRLCRFARQHSGSGLPRTQPADRHYDWSSAEIIDTGETYALAIVGGGMAGLGAALKFTQTRKDGERLLLLDNHPVFGGESKPQRIRGRRPPPGCPARRQRFLCSQARYWRICRRRCPLFRRTGHRA